IPKLISNYKLSLYDITGQKVLEEKEIMIETYELKRGALSKGVYFLEIKTNTNRYIKRIMVD
ncbi:MAG: T9SS type A sorting domain-containing protein, partial [Bacteroidota bacterium]|nr:T9SS type A sorting domain-containing protein [Bacteroidota bacterium]